MSEPGKIARDTTIDALRGVAALAVVVGHVLLAAYRESDSAVVRQVSYVLAVQFFDWGRFGVTLFFLISGYVVPEYLIRGGALRGFVVQRLLRIFPAFWLSLVLVVTLKYATSSDFPGWRVVLANATLFPNLVGAQWLSGVYWTLNIELWFYFLCVVGGVA